ncbi:MAG TPA: immunoglobulin domain-containing protein, partial [Candidatus Synoicihabitans sp.]|nr:immunoglobulin domain-containing protein [Candidatus Synoicihabitans sp.]
VISGGTTQTAPAFTTHPQSQTVAAGSNVTFTVTVTGSPVPTLQWRRDGTNLAGATSASLALTNVQAANAGSYTVVATNAAGSATSNPATLTVTTGGGTSAPTIVTQPLSLRARTGGVIALTVAATGNPMYQWRKDGVNIAGATAETLVLENVGAAQAGSYTVQVSNAAGSVTSDAATLTVADGPESAVTNLSVRTSLATGSTLIVGFATTANRGMLIRGIGPTLSGFGLSGVMEDPRIDLVPQGQSVAVASNNDWDAALAPLFTSLGAFPLVAGSKDGALRREVTGPHSALVTGTGAGILLVEVYDAAAAGTAGRLVNVSARNRVGTGDNVMIAGFFVAGEVANTLVIRAVGQRLVDFGVTGVLANPKLEIYETRNGQSVKLAENDNWNAALQPYADRVGGFPLLAGSNDSTLVLSLPPGLYSAVVSGVGATTGEALVEVYELR